MGILREEVKGDMIYNVIKSSNIKESTYNISTSTMTVTFNNGLQYEYKDVPHKVYAQFRLAESQGKFFTTEISKKYEYKKM
jgi:c-di-GMP-binding flagellar brake protein YcgR